jgi:hypothetical protein
MKTKDLIALLQKADPTGEINVCVGNVDISWAGREPAYYDGPSQVIIKNEKGRPIGGKYHRKGDKVQIHLWPFSTLIWDYKDIVIDYSELDEERQISFKENHDKIRTAAKNLDYELELENFMKWIKDKAKTVFDNDEDEMSRVAKEFFDKNITPYDKISDDIPIIGESYITRRQIQWDRELNLSYDADGFHIKKKED